jgi:hypothetical protein
LARSLGDWRDARQASQGVVISPSQRIRGFCEQRGEDDPSNARQGSQDRHVTLLIELPLGIILSISEPLSQMVDAVIGLADLAVEEIEPLGDGFEMGRRRVHGSGGGRDGWRVQPFEHPSCCQAADAMAFEEPIRPVARGVHSKNRVRKVQGDAKTARQKSMGVLRNIIARLS